MAELPLEAEETGLDPPEGLTPQRFEDTDNARPAESPMEDSVPTIPSDPVLLRDRYFIYTRQPLPLFDRPSAKAFVAEDRNDPARELYALICTPGLPVRLNSIKYIKGADTKNLLPLIEWDSLYWPALNQKTIAIIYARPLGGRLIDTINKKETKITEYDLPNRIISPITQALQSLSFHNLSYRALRPENLLFLDNDLEQLVLGPNVTAPAGYDQSLIFEPINRALADPAGRGAGDSLDDIYALGVNIVLLLLGYNPVADMSDTDLLEARLTNGSYNAICGGITLPVRLIEPLRGMLADNPDERWDLDEIDNWLTGQKFNSVKRKPQNKFNTYFKFRGNDYTHPSILAWHFSQDPKDAAKAIKSDAFGIWLERGLKQEEHVSAIKGAIQNTKFYADSYQGTDEYLTTRVTAILDPEGPIRYKGLAFMPDGYGPLLAVEWIRNNNPKPAADVLSHSIANFWQTPLLDQSEEHLDSVDEFSKYRGLLAIQDPGYGLERVLYETNPGIVCQSTYVIKDGVMLIEQLLPALDKAANEIETTATPIDRHIAGFIAARFSEDIHPHLKAIASNKSDTSVIGILSLLALLQWKLKAPAMLALSSWVGGLLGPAINAYKNRQTRMELENTIPRLVRKGSLPELFNLVDNPEKRQNDANGFTTGCAEWLAAETEIREIEGAGEERLTKAERSGQQVAAIISIAIALIAIAVLISTEFV